MSIVVFFYPTFTSPFRTASPSECYFPDRFSPRSALACTQPTKCFSNVPRPFCYPFTMSPLFQNQKPNFASSSDCVALNDTNPVWSNVIHHLFFLNYFCPYFNHHKTPLNGSFTATHKELYLGCCFPHDLSRFSLSHSLVSSTSGNKRLNRT